MKNWLILPLFVPWCSLFVTLLQKIVVEFASTDIEWFLKTCFKELWFLLPLRASPSSPMVQEHFISAYNCSPEIVEVVPKFN